MLGYLLGWEGIDLREREREKGGEQTSLLQNSLHFAAASAGDVVVVLSSGTVVGMTGIGGVAGLGAVGGMTGTAFAVSWGRKIGISPVLVLVGDAVAREERLAAPPPTVMGDAVTRLRDGGWWAESAVGMTGTKGVLVEEVVVVEEDVTVAVMVTVAICCLRILSGEERARGRMMRMRGRRKGGCMIGWFAVISTAE